MAACATCYAGGGGFAEDVPDVEAAVFRYGGEEGAGWGPGAGGAGLCVEEVGLEDAEGGGGVGGVEGVDPDGAVGGAEGEGVGVGGVGAGGEEVYFFVAFEFVGCGDEGVGGGGGVVGAEVAIEAAGQ